MTLKPLQDSQGSLPKQLRPVWELLRQRSIGAINEGLSAFSELAAENSAAADHIFDAVGVSPRPSSRSAVAGLVAGPRFTRTDVDANPYLLYALLGLLSHAPIRSRGAELRQAIQWLNLECPAIPELQGFAGLIELKLSIHHPPDSSEKPTPYALADRIAPFPCLEKLELHTEDPYTFERLEWLPAPKLKVLKASGVGLQSILGLEEISSLKVVEVCGNEQLSDVTPLSRSAPGLRRLNLSGTGIDGLSGIGGLQKLEELNINNCRGVAGLDSLSQVTITNTFALDGLDSLSALSSLPVLTGECLILKNLRRIKSLEGLEHATDIRSLVIEELPMLQDALALEMLTGLQTVSISSCRNLQSLKCLESLPALTRVRISCCPNLDQLPTTWPISLQVLQIDHCINTQIGRLPDGYSGELDLSECHCLQTLEGLESSTQLRSVRVGPRPIDFSAMAKLPNTWLWLDFQYVKKDELRLSDGLVEALAALPSCRLGILNFVNPTNWKLESSDLAPLARIPHLRALDISHLHVDGASFVMGLEELEVLKVAPRTDLSSTLGGCTFDSATELAKLKLSLLGMG